MGPAFTKVLEAGGRIWGGYFIWMQRMGKEPFWQYVVHGADFEA